MKIKLLKHRARVFVALMIVMQILLMPIAAIAADSLTPVDTTPVETSAPAPDPTPAADPAPAVDPTPAPVADPAPAPDATPVADPDPGSVDEAVDGETEEDGDCYTVSIVEVENNAAVGVKPEHDDLELIETPGLVINDGVDGKITNLMFTFEEIGNSNIATVDIKIPGGFFWEYDLDKLVVAAGFDITSSTAVWQASGYDYVDDNDYSKGGTLSLYGDALFQGGWVSATLLNIKTPDEPGIYEFETEVQALKTFSDHSPIYHIDYDTNGDPIRNTTDGKTIGHLQYKPNQLAVGHDQPTLWVAGNEVIVDQEEYIKYATKHLVDPLKDLLLYSLNPLNPDYDLTITGPWVDGGVVQQAIDGAKAYDVVTLEALDAATMAAIVAALTGALNSLNGFDLPVSAITDLLPFGDQYIVDQLDLNKSIYLRGTGDNETSLMLIGPAGGGNGIITSGNEVEDDDEYHIHISNLNIEQSQLPFLSPTVEFWRETEYVPPTENWNTTWYYLLGNTNLQVTIPAGWIESPYSHFKPTQYSTWNSWRKGAWDLYGCYAVWRTNNSINPSSPFNDTKSGTEMSLDIHQVDNYLMKIAHIDSLTMENTNVSGAGRLYHTFDVQRVLDALNSLGLGISDVEPVIGLVQNPEDVSAWLNFFNGLNVDFESALGLMPEILSIVVDAYRWNNAITGVDLNDVDYANLSNVTVEKFSRNGISFTDVPTIFMSDITVQKTGGHFGSAGVAFYGDIRNVEFGGGRISRAPIGINVGALDSHGWNLQHLGNLFGCPYMPIIDASPANIKLRNIDFDQNLVGVVNLGGMTNGHYSPNFFTVDARCNDWNSILFDKIGLVLSCGTPAECAKPNLPEKPTYTIVALNQSKTHDGLPHNHFPHDGHGEINGIDFNLDGIPSFGEAEGKIEVGNYAIQISGLRSLNYFIDFVDAELVISPEPEVIPPVVPPGNGGVGTGFYNGLGMPAFTPLTLTAPGSAGDGADTQLLALAPEAPLVNPGQFLVIPPEDPETELEAIVTVQFVREGSAEELEAILSTYEAMLAEFDANWESLNDSEYAYSFIDLTVAWAALQLAEARLSGSADDLNEAVEAYQLALKSVADYGDQIADSQMEVVMEVMAAIAEELEALGAEL